MLCIFQQHIYFFGYVKLSLINSKTIQNPLIILTKTLFFFFFIMKSLITIIIKKKIQFKNNKIK